ncbi:10443_t:CDS:2, partial [Funneliformis mosseae]
QEQCGLSTDEDDRHHQLSLFQFMIFNCFNGENFNAILDVIEKWIIRYFLALVWYLLVGIIEEAITMSIENLYKFK